MISEKFECSDVDTWAMRKEEMPANLPANQRNARTSWYVTMPSQLGRGNFFSSGIAVLIQKQITLTKEPVFVERYKVLEAC
jgi:hypothetical protein